MPDEIFYKHLVVICILMPQLLMSHTWSGRLSIMKLNINHGYTCRALYLMRNFVADRIEE